MCTTLCSVLPGARRFASGLLVLALAGTTAWPSEAQLAIFQVWSLDSPAVNEAANAFDGFGEAVAAGDFDGDGWSDLAFGVPGGEVLTIFRAGRVQVLYGGPEGLGTQGQQTLTQGTLGSDPIEADDQFGSTLAAGDFNGDGFDDLAVGAPWEDLGAVVNAGVVDVFYGGVSDGGERGLLPSTLQRWSQDSDGLDGAAQFGDRFGSRLAVGDFDSDGRDDLVVAAIDDDVEGALDAGVVHVIFGTPGDGLDGSDSRRLRQGFNGLPETAEAGDLFGSGLAAGDFDGDGNDDLAIGALGENLPAGDNVGHVIVIPGHFGGLLSGSAEEFTQPGLLEEGDLFGAALAAGDFDRDGYEDLAIGHPGEVIGGVGLGEGAVTVLRGSDDGITTAQSVILHQEVDGVGGETADLDSFGGILAAGDLDSDGYADLIVGVPSDDIFEQLDPGRMHVFYGTGEGISVAGSQDFVIAPTADEEFGGALAIGPFGAGFVLAVAKPAADISGQSDAGSVVVFRSDEIFSDNFESGAIERWD